MGEKARTSTLTECLFTLVDLLNTVVDRLDILANKQERILIKNEEVFKLAREDFFRRLIEVEVDRGIEKKKRKDEIRNEHIKNGKVRKGITFNIISGNQGDN